MTYSQSEPNLPTKEGHDHRSFPEFEDVRPQNDRGAENPHSLLSQGFGEGVGASEE